MVFWDLHTDLGYAIWKKQKAGYRNILSSFYTAGLKQGAIKVVCAASYFNGSQSWEQMQEMVRATRRELADCKEITPVYDAKDIDWEADTLYAVMSVEGMCGIVEDVEEKLDWLYAQGVRLASLCWNEENALATGQRGRADRGLSALGIRAVQHMERIGMRIDVSHANEKTFWDIMEHTEGMIVASHSNARALCDHPRNLRDEQIQAIAKRNGVIGVVAEPAFVHPDPRKQDIAHLIGQLEYMVALAGPAHVGFGFDFMDYYDGEGTGVAGIRTPGETQALQAWLDAHPLYEKTASKNAARVLSF